MDIRAHIRGKKLWKYTQSPPPEDLTAAQKTKWEESTQEAADNMTPTISPAVKQKLGEAEFNDGYVMLTKITALYQSKGEAEFMRLTKEYYTIDYHKFGSMSEYLTHIKLLEERIRSTKVTLDDDKQTLICLTLSLPEHLQYLIKIWSITPEMTAEKTRNILLKEERRFVDKKVKKEEESYGYRGSGYRASGYMASTDKCSTCGKAHREEDCWQKHSDKASEWLKLKWKTQELEKKNMDKNEHTDKKARFVDTNTKTTTATANGTYAF